MEKFDELIQSEKAVLVYFFATWCGPCAAMQPVLEELKEQLGAEPRIFKINVDQHEDLTIHYQINNVPTFMIFKKGEMLWRRSGVIRGSELKAAVKQYS